MKNEMKEIKAEPAMIAFCGLYCGACRSYLSGKCPGCSENKKATWCKVRTCCMENNLKSCADCQITDVHSCKKFNNFMSRLFGLILNSDRAACIDCIRQNGYEQFSVDMAEGKRQTIARR